LHDAAVLARPLRPRCSELGESYKCDGTYGIRLVSRFLPSQLPVSRTAATGFPATTVVFLSSRVTRTPNVLVVGAAFSESLQRFCKGTVERHVLGRRLGFWSALDHHNHRAANGSPGALRALTYARHWILLCPFPWDRMREKGAHDVSDLGLASSRQRKGFQPRLDVHRLYLVAGFNGYQAALVRRQLTPVLISSLSGAAGLLRLIFFRQSSLRWTLQSRHTHARGS
jgi:hypothetical protein